MPLSSNSIDGKNSKDVKYKSKLINEPILCKHCQRTKTNNIRCRGMCVEENEY